ncbi:Uma2 family endonuclease [Romeria aff. gracilis LEGE 07310]|uniref:Uma2 family endonuclease n=1 Tax=Vasconcelosia minhoensis LEGE 07310 TaxID=915328 RepID=A0A8J7ABU3_9CYAN|nr:Uma2 family endonuclease [Romeria gracilis]MBE9080155.1 Uma2 family endonuclease [Romeria aff. gracilis LEGE 07310]
MSPSQLQPVTDIWIGAAWRDYILVLEDLAQAQAKGYYYREHMRIEMLPVGFDHSKDHSLVALGINLFAIANSLTLTLLDSCSFRKAGRQECQPDLAAYLGPNAQAIPQGTSIVDLDRYPAPDLAVEISKTTLLDDLGIKRSLYESIGIAEYWVVDVQAAQVIAYQIVANGSRRIDISQVLPSLSIALLDDALRRSRNTAQSTVGAWLMSQFQS